jgi:hypothetical protein
MRQRKQAATAAAPEHRSSSWAAMLPALLEMQQHAQQLLQ